MSPNLARRLIAPDYSAGCSVMIHEHDGAKRLRMRNYVTNNSGYVIIEAFLVAHMQRTVTQTGSEAYFARDPRAGGSV